MYFWCYSLVNEKKTGHIDERKVRNGRVTKAKFICGRTDNEGVKEIKKHKNIYTDDTKPIALKDREWGVKNYITLWTGILVSVRSTRWRALFWRQG